MTRKMVTRIQELPGSGPWDLPTLNKLARNKQNWRLHMVGQYESAQIMQMWEEPETDLEMVHRIKREQKSAQNKTQREARNLARERQQYEQLKSKFES